MSVEARRRQPGVALFEPPPPGAVLPRSRPAPARAALKGVETRCCHRAQGTQQDLQHQRPHLALSGEGLASSPPRRRQPGVALFEPPPPGAVLPRSRPAPARAALKGVETRCCHRAQGTQQDLQHQRPHLALSREGLASSPCRLRPRRRQPGVALFEPPSPGAVLPRSRPAPVRAALKGVETRCCHRAQGTQQDLQHSGRILLCPVKALRAHHVG